MKKLHKTLCSFLILAAFCFLLTGCVETSIGVRVDGDGGGDLVTTLSINKDFYDMMKDGGEVSGLEGMTEGETTVDGTDYVTFTGTKSYKTYAELETALLELRFLETDEGGDSEAAGIFKSVEIKKDGWLFESKYTFSAVTNAQTADEEMTESGMSFGDIFKLYLEVAMPGDISESKGGEVDGHTLKYDITNLTQENEITAVSRSFNTIAVVFVVALIVLLIALFAALSLKGKRGRD